MKIIQTLIVVSSLFAAAAHASTIAQQGFVSKLNKFEVDAGLGLSGSVQDGIIAIDMSKSSAKITLKIKDEKINITTLQMPIVHSNSNACGVTVIIAEKNYMDGMRQTMIITDSSQSHCSADKLSAPTVVELQTQSLSPTQSTRSFFSGRLLAPTSNLNINEHI